MLAPHYAAHVALGYRVNDIYELHAPHASRVLDLREACVVTREMPKLSASPEAHLQGEADLDLVLARAVYQMRPAGSLH